MSVIENFAELSFEEQKAFAESLVKTINSEHTFTNEVNFKIVELVTEDLAGDLIIGIEHDGLINVTRPASWTSADEDDMYDDPGYDVDYENSIFEDAKKAFKTLSAEIEGYKVTIEVEDVDEDNTVEVEVTDHHRDDAGIGEYEYWGHVEYDSQPYMAVEGNLVKACACQLSLYVEPATAVTPEVTEA